MNESNNYMGLVVTTILGSKTGGDQEMKHKNMFRHINWSQKWQEMHLGK
jgi:hypothetical protein